MCEKRFRNGHGDNAVGMGTTCHHRSVVDRHRSQHPDRGHKAVHQGLYAQTATQGAPSRHSQGSALIQGEDGEFRSVRFGRCDDYKELPG